MVAVGDKLRQCARVVVARRDRIVPILLSICLVVSSNTIPGSEFMDGLIAKAGLALGILLCMGIVVRAFVKRHLTLREMGIWLVFAGLFGLAYVAIWLHAGNPGDNVQLAALIILYAVALAWVALNRQGRAEQMLVAFVDVVVVLAVSSFVLWLFGPVLGLIRPNIKMKYSWAPGDGTGTSIVGYFYLLFYTQGYKFLGHDIARNSGIFVESPLYAFVLIVALLIELFLIKRKARPLVTITLVATIVSTFSITSYLILVVVAAFLAAPYVHAYFVRVRGDRRKFTLAVIATVAVVGAGLFVVVRKLTSPSWAIRADDFSAGIRAWLQSPLLGNGLHADQAIVNQMGGFRLNNTGMSNSVTQVLAFGGVALLLVYLQGLVGYFVKGRKRCVYFGITYLLMWSVTVVTFLPVSMLVVGIGLGELVLRINRTELWGGWRERPWSYRMELRHALACLGIAVVVAGLGGGATWWLAGRLLPVEYVARTNVEVVDTKHNKRVVDPYSLDHVAYVLSSQNLYLSVLSHLDVDDPTHLTIKAKPLTKSVDLACTSREQAVGEEFVARAVGAANRISWMSKYRYVVRRSAIETTPVNPSPRMAAVFGAGTAFLLVSGVAFVGYGPYAARRRDA